MVQPAKNVFEALIIKFDVTQEVNGKVLTALSLLGAYVAFGYIKIPLIAIWRHILRPRKNLTSRYGGKWALITGASDGLGEAYAHELAKSGFNIVILSRTQEKMEKVASDLRSQHGVETRII